MTSENAKDLTEQVRDALRVVIDPELGWNIVDLGFIYGISIDNGVAWIVMTATSRGCPAAEFLKEGVAAGAATVSGIDRADVTLTFDPPWTPSMMCSGAKSALGFAEVH